MLHHTSGLGDFEGLLELSGRHILDFHSKEEVIDLIVSQKSLNNVPGDKWFYSARTHIVYSFTNSKENLVAWGEPLRRIGPNKFRDVGSGIITFDKAEGQMKLSLEYLGENFFSGSRIEEPRLGDSDLAEFVGLYKSAELSANVQAVGG